MKRTFLDKIVILIILILLGLFILLATFTTREIQQVLINERQENLLSEANLLVEQTIISYSEGEKSLHYLQTRFDEFMEMLHTDIWFFSEEGVLIAAANTTSSYKTPTNLLKIDSKMQMNQGFRMAGDFYGMFENSMVSIGLPVYIDETVEGYLVLHTSMEEMDNLQSDVLTVMYMPFLVILLVVVVLLAYLTKMIIRPIVKLNVAAREYAKGNFEVKTGVEQNDEIGELSNSLEYMASELSKLDEYRKNFIANISHDFRSPLTSIKGYLVAMLDGTIPLEKYNRYLYIVLNESNRLTKLTASLLELNNFDTHGPILEKVNFDVVDLVRTTRNILEGVCEKKNIDVQINSSAKNTTVYADKMKIGQVIHNLIDNAIKFSPQNGIIAVSIYEKNGKLFVSVKDQGPGIAKEKQQKVFERFYKTDSSRGKDKQGTGLGLAITKEIIKAHGENINLVSTEGAGSEFVFSLAKSITRENGQIG